MAFVTVAFILFGLPCHGNPFAKQIVYFEGEVRIHPSLMGTVGTVGTVGQ